MSNSAAPADAIPSNRRSDTRARRARRCGKCKACDGRARDILQRERFAEIAEMAGRVAGYESPLRTARSVCALAERVAVWRDVDALAGLVELCAFVLR